MPYGKGTYGSKKGRPPKKKSKMKKKLRRNEHKSYNTITNRISNSNR